MRAVRLLILWHAYAIASGSVIQARSHNCIEVSFSVSATAQNRVVFIQPDFSTIEGIIAFATQPIQFTQVSGTETLRGKYCAPTVNVPSRAHTLQLLVHGATYDHNYFSGLNAFPSNSWVAYANAQGYATLAIDRLGCGASSHPDPIKIVQLPYQVELYRNLILQIRSIGAPGMPKFTKIVWVGHSLASAVGNYLASAHPTAIDSYILTGIAVPRPNQTALKGISELEFVQASTYNRRRFPPAKFPLGYYVTANKTARENSYYGNPVTDFNPLIFDLDFRTEGTSTAGEALGGGYVNVTSYAGPVFILTGRQDALNCGTGSRTLGVPDCGTGPTSQLAAMKEFYPAVPSNLFDWYAQEHSGHCLQLHYAAQSGFQRAHQWLEQIGW